MGSVSGSLGLAWAGEAREADKQKRLGREEER